MQKCFGLVRCICQYRYVIGVVGVGDCCCGVSSASFLRQFEAILFDFVNRLGEPDMQDIAGEAEMNS